MKPTCPKGCDHAESWSHSLTITDHEQGEFCDTCGSEIFIFDPEAERDWEEFVRHREEREHAVVKGIFIGWISMFVIEGFFKWWLS